MRFKKITFIYSDLLFIAFFSLSVVFSFASEEEKSRQIPSQLRFTENVSQWDKKIRYRTDFNGGRLFLEKNAFTYVFYEPYAFAHKHDFSKNAGPGLKSDVFKLHALKVHFLNSNINTELKGTGIKPGYSNFFIGKDPEKWASKVKSYENVLYDNIFPSIDLKVSSELNNVKYDFEIQPGASTESIKLLYEGAEKLEINEGRLIIHTSVGEISEENLYAFQIIGNKKIAVPCCFKLNGDTVSFVFPKGYNKDFQLLIDPTLVFSTFTGSTADNWGMTATYDGGGNAYTGGIVFEAGYPVVPAIGAYQGSFAGGGRGGGNGSGFNCDVSISKFNPSGSALIYSTYLGGLDNEQPASLIVNDNDELLVFGRTYSSNFPTPLGYDNTYNGGADIFICKFNSAGTSLIAGTFFGGSSDDGVNIASQERILSSLKYNYSDDGRGEIITDATGNVYIAASTQSTDFPTSPGAVQPAFAGGLQDACVFKLDPNLSLTWSTYLGGRFNDAAYALALDNSSNVYVTGGTRSIDFPFTPGAIHTAFMGGEADGFVTRIKNDGSSILASSYIGTPYYDQSYFVQTDKNDDVYLYGQTGGHYPVSAGVYSNSNGGQFIHKLSSDLTTSIFSTVFGTGKGTPDISPTAFLVDKCENIYICGWGGSLGDTTTIIDTRFNPPFVYSNNQNVKTSSTTNLDTTSNAFQKTTDGSDFYFLVLKKDAKTLWYATFFGGPLSGEHVDGGTSRFDKNGIVYQAICGGCGGFSDMTTSPTAYSTSNLSQFSTTRPNTPNCNNALFKFEFDLRDIYTKGITITADTICAPSPVEFKNNSTGAKNFIWNFHDNTAIDTNSSPTHIFKKPGTYKVSLVGIDSASCTFADTAHINIEVKDSIIVNLGNDTIVCGIPNVPLNAGNPGNNYIWSNGESTQSITATDRQKYWVTVSSNYCKNADTIFVSFLTDETASHDTVLCGMDFIELTAGNPKSTSYLWSTGEATQKIKVYHPDNYWVKLEMGACSLTDTINVAGEKPLFTPNAFTPNGDEMNDLFSPFVEDIIDFRMEIYDKWGLLLYKTVEINKGWDGKYNNKPAKADIYVYLVDYKTVCTPKDKQQHMVGYLLLEK